MNKEENKNEELKLIDEKSRLADLFVGTGAFQLEYMKNSKELEKIINSLEDATCNTTDESNYSNYKYHLNNCDIEKVEREQEQLNI